MTALILPTHENEILLECPYYWDSYEVAIEKQIEIITAINNGEYKWLEEVSRYYSSMSTLLFDKLYCADYHHIHKAVLSETQGSLNQEVINEFFRLNFENEHFNYDDLLINIRKDIIKAVKEYTFNLSFEELQQHAHNEIDKFISTFSSRYWLLCKSEQDFTVQDQFTDESFITFRRAKQLEKHITDYQEEFSYFLSSHDYKDKSYIKAIYSTSSEHEQSLIFLNISSEEYFNKKINN